MNRDEMQSRNDRRQAFADVVTAEAWHDAFGDGLRVADLHVDVVFGTARIGEDPASPVRFRLSVKQAEVVVVVPNLEPVEVDPTSVARDAPRVSGTRKTVEERHGLASFGGKLFGRTGPRGANGGAAMSAGFGRSRTETEILERSEELAVIAVTQSKTEDGHYRWIMSPPAGGALEGRPWDAVSAPRLKLIDVRSRQGGLAPVVRLEIRCRREDLVIADLCLKDEKAWLRNASRPGAANRKAAAESYIRDRLIGDGLEVGDLGELFSRLTLVSVAADARTSR